MNKSLIIGVAIVVFAGLGYVISTSSQAGSATGSLEVYKSSDYPDLVPVFLDEKTGCQYLVFNKGGITPRLSSAGVPLCTEPTGLATPKPAP